MKDKTEKANATENGNEPSWDLNEYAKRKAQRNEKKPAEWVTNPATGEKFYLRRVGALGLAMSGQISHLLTNRAVEAWKENGLDVGESDDDEERAAAATDPEGARTQAQKNIEFATRIALEACVIPKLGKGKGEVDPALLDDADLLFIVDWATKPAGSVPTKGGGAASIASLEGFPGKPGKRSRARTRS